MEHFNKLASISLLLLLHLLLDSPISIISYSYLHTYVYTCVCVVLSLIYPFFTAIFQSSATPYDSLQGVTAAVVNIRFARLIVKHAVLV